MKMKSHATRNRAKNLTPVPRSGYDIECVQTYCKRNDGILFASVQEETQETKSFFPKKGKKKNRFPREIFSIGVVDHRRSSAGHYKSPSVNLQNIKGNLKTSPLISKFDCNNQNKEANEVNQIQEKLPAESIELNKRSIYNSKSIYESFLPNIHNGGIPRNLNFHTIEQSQTIHDKIINKKKIPCMSANQCANLAMVSSKNTEPTTMNYKPSYYFSSPISPKTDSAKPIKITPSSVDSKLSEISKSSLFQQACMQAKISSFSTAKENELGKTAYFKADNQANVKKNSKYNFLNRIEESLKKYVKKKETCLQQSNFNLRQMQAKEETNDKCEITFGHLEDTLSH